MRINRLPLFCLLLSSLAAPVKAAPLQFSYNAGPLIDFAFFDPFAPPVVQDFILFENIIVNVTIDSEASFTAEPDGTLVYTDMSGMISIEGADSSTEVILAPGVTIEVENQNEFDVFTPFPTTPQIVAGDFFMSNDTDYRTDVDFLTDPTSLTSIVADIDAHFINGLASTRNLSSGSTAVVQYADLFEGAELGSLIALDDADFFFALEFGPVASVPVPLGAPFLIGSVAGLLLLRRLKTSAV